MFFVVLMYVNPPSTMSFASPASAFVHIPPMAISLPANSAVTGQPAEVDNARPMVFSFWFSNEFRKCIVSPYEICIAGPIRYTTPFAAYISINELQL